MPETSVAPANILYRHARDSAVSAALKAAEYIRASTGEIDEADIRSKGLHDLVTRVDEESQRLIVDMLREEFPDHGFLAEEELKMPEEESGDTEAESSFLWIIDPLDGTTNFTRSIPPYAVSIGLQDKGELVVGVVLDIPSGDLFTAVKGDGTYMNGKRVSVSRTSRLANGMVTTGFPYRSFGHIDSYLSVLRRFMQTCRGVRRPGSAAVDLAWIACGRFDGFFETGLMPWDVAAGMVLVREAGGKITDYTGGTSPRLGAQIVATNSHVHEEMLSILSPMKDVFE
jgi:myo-inositol-1(or 4)-monophosphatase